MTVRPVVVGVDGSEESLRAVEWAALEAVRRKAPLRIVSAPASPPRPRAYQVSQRSVSNAVLGMAARALGAAITRSEEVAPGLLIDTELLEPGSPAVAVTECGAGAAMLVVGARGAAPAGGVGWAAVLLGSVSRYVASHGLCPVVVVREQTMAVHRSVVVGVRDPLRAADAIEFAFEEARDRAAELVVVHVVQAPPREAALASRCAGQDLAGALRPWQHTYRGVPVRQDVVSGHPAQVLSSYCSRADLIVLGRHDAPGASHSVGSTWHAVLDHATSPVAVIPPAPRPDDPPADAGHAAGGTRPAGAGQLADAVG